MTAVEKISVVVEAELDTASFQKSSNQVLKYARDTKKALDPELYLKLELDVAKLQSQLANAKGILAQAKKSGDQDLVIRTQIETNRLQVWLTEAKRQLNNFVNTGDKDLSRLQAKFNQIWDEVKKTSFDFKWLWETLVWAGIIAWVQSLAKWVLSVAASFQTYDTILTNALWSTEAAKEAFSLLKNISSETPFSLDEITKSYIKLVNRWIVPTREEIIKLWDLASSQGKSFDQLVEAVLDAQTWEFERLKEFGVKAKVSWDQVSFTFKWVTQTVAKTDEAIKSYLLWLWDLQGIQWAMVWQSATFNGAISNLWDAFTNLKATIGNVFLPILTPLIRWFSDFITSITKLSEESPVLARAITLITGALWLLLLWLWGYLAITPFLTAANLALLASFSALLWPIALVIWWITALAVAYDNNLLWFRDFANWIVTEWKVIIEFFRLLLSEVWSVLSETWSIFKWFIKTIKDQIWWLSISQWPFSVFFKNLRDIVIDNVFPIINIINNMLQLLGKIPWVSSLVWKARANVAQQNAVSLWITSPAKYNPFAVAKTQSALPWVTWWAGSKWWWGGKSKAQEEQEKLKKAEEERFKMIEEKWKKAFDWLNDSIKKSSDEVTKLQDKLKWVTDELAWIDQSIANRILTIEESLRTAQGEERLKLEEELALAKANIDEATLKTARDEAAKSETQKLLDKKTKLQEEMLAIQEKIDYELQAQKDLNEAKARLEEVFTKKYEVELQKRENALEKSINRQIALATRIPSFGWWASGTTSNINNTKNININANINNSSDADSLFRKISQ